METSNPACESPSLQATVKRSFEAKFLTSEEIARRVEESIADRLVLDPHVKNGERAYDVETLYFDTAAFSVFHKAPGFRTTKHRIRRYGDSPSLFLERKTKSAGRVRKSRSTFALVDLPRLTDKPTMDAEWFTSRVRANALAPVCRIAYERTAYFGDGDTGPMRMTFDRRLRACPASSLEWTTDVRRTPLPIAGVIVELKFTESMPLLFKKVVEGFGLTTTTASKYRAAVEVLRLDSQRDVRHA